MSSKRSNLLLSKDYQSKKSSKQTTNQNNDDDENLTQEDKINRRVQSVLKTLPSKKDENLIKFKSFYECIKDVKILSEVQFDTYRKEESKNEHDSTTFLYDKMLEWDELNLTKHYIQFRSNIQSFVRTLPEMIHHKETICDIFVNHLRIKDSLAYQPILDLVTIFAKDLRQEFYPLFPRLFYPIVYNINISLWFEKYSKILSHKKWYIRKFAAESFSFLINKLSDEELKIYVEKVFNLLIEKPSQIMYDGVSQMFFESMKGILGNLHSKMSRLLPLLFRQLNWNLNYNGTIKQQLADIGNKFTLIEKYKQTVYTFYRKLMKTIGNEQESNTIVKEFLRFVNDDINYNFDSTVAFLLNFIHTNTTSNSNLDTNLEYTLLSDKNSKFIQIIYNKFIEIISNIKSQQDLIQFSKQSNSLLLLWSILNILSIYGKKSDQYLKNLYENVYKFLLQFIKLIDQSQYEKKELQLLQIIIAQSLTLLNQVLHFYNKNFNNLIEIVMEISCKFGSSLQVLISCNQLIDNVDSNLLTNDKFKIIAESLKSNLQSKSDNLRLETLKYLTKFEQDEIQKGIVLNKVETTKCVVLEFLRDSEECGFDWDQSRNRTVLLEKANEFLKRYTIPQIYKTLISNYVFGSYFTKYQIVWEPTSNLASTMMRINFKEFWNLLIPIISNIYQKSRDSKKEDDILLVFNSFYENEFKEYDIEEVVNFITRNPMTGRLEKLLNLISEFNEDFFKKEKSKFIKSVIFRLFSTSTISIQLLSLKCLQKFNLPYLTSKTVKNLQKVISSNRSVEHLSKLDFINIPKQYKQEYIHLHLKVIEPYLLMFDMTKKRGKNSKDAMIKKWKIRVHQVIEFLGQLPKETLEYFINMLFNRFKSIDNNNGNDSNIDSNIESTNTNNSDGKFAEDLIKANTFQLRWLLDIIEEILTCLTGNYHYFYNQVLDLLITIIELRVDAHEMEVDQEEEEQKLLEQQLLEQEEEEEEDDEQDESSTIKDSDSKSSEKSDKMTDEVDDEDDDQDDDDDESTATSIQTTSTTKSTIAKSTTSTTTTTTDNNTSYYSSSKQKVSLTLTFKRAVELLELFFDRKQEFDYSIEFTSHVISLFTKFFENINKKSSRIEELPSYFSILFSWFDKPKLYYLIKYYEKELIFKFIELIDQYNVSNVVFDQVLSIFDKILSNKDEIFMNLNPNFSKITTDIENGLTIGMKIFEPSIINQILIAFYNLFIESNYSSKSINNNNNNNNYKSKNNSYNNNNNNNNNLNKLNDELNEQSNEKQEFSKKCFKLIDKMKGYFDETSPADIILTFYGTSIRDGSSLNEDEARHKEWILRDSSSQSLLNIIEIIKFNNEMKEIKRLLILHVKRLSFSDKLLEKSESMLVYSKMIDQFIELENLKPFSKSLELISNVNYQKKLEGLQIINSILIPIEKCKIQQDYIYQIVPPLIYELMVINDKSIQDLVKQLCIYLVTVLDWNYSHPILNQLVTMMGTYGLKVLSKRKKLALDIICQIVDVFPFDKINDHGFNSSYSYNNRNDNNRYNNRRHESEEPLSNSTVTIEKDTTNDDDDNDADDNEMIDENEIPKGRRMKRYFMKDFIPKVTKFLWDKKLEIYVMRMQVCFLIIKVLRRCDKTQLDVHLSKMVLDVLGKLKSKDEEQQQVAGKALIDMFKELGTVHSVMLILLNENTYPPLKTFKKRKVSRFDIEKAQDYENQSSIGENSVSLTASDSSSSKHFKSKHENTLFNCFELLGSIIDIKKSLSYIINDINFKIRIVHNAEILKRFEFVFKFLLKGLMRNRQVIQSNQSITNTITNNTTTKQSNQSNNNSEMLLNVIKNELYHYRLYKKNFTTITDGEQDRFHSVKTTKDRKEENFLVQKEPGRLGAIDQANDMKMKLLAGLIDNSHIIVQFYLKMFEKCIKRFKIQVDKHLEMMNEIIPLLLKYVSGNHLNVALVSFRILIEICKRTPKVFKILEDSKQLLLNSTFDILTNSGIDSTNLETWETIYTGIKYFLQSDISHKYPLSLGQLDILLDMLKIEISSTRKTYSIQTFQILSNLIDNKVQIPQIYDLMDKSITIMLTTLEMEIQKTIVEMLVNFYLNYPFTNEVLQDKLNYLFKNVLNENMSNESKLSILNLIQTIIKKFPNNFLNDKTELIYYPLILELEKQCKKRVIAGDNKSISSIVSKLRETLQFFIKILNDENLIKIIKITNDWILNEKKLKPIGVNSILILSNVSNGSKLKSSSEFYENMIPQLISIIENSDTNLEKYPSLVLETLECFYSLFSQSIISFQHVDEIWNSLLKIICDENDLRSEIRLESLKIFELFVSKKKKNESKILNHLQYLEQMSISIIELFKSQYINDTNVIVIVKVLIYLFKLLDSNNGSEILHKLFKSLRKISNQTFDFDTNENITFRRMNILKLFIGLASKYGNQLQPYLIYMTPLIYRCCEFSNRDKSIVTIELEKFAKESKQLIQQSLTDSNLFVQAYEEGRKLVESKSEKKSKSKEQSIISKPSQYAKKRLESNSKKNDTKKRKLKESFNQPTVQISSSGNVQQVKKKKKK
ncbi:predicted protein [Naegleria gruberi]|uniref:Predicted protein n=1 Tax=Naegleria gruberi TaxID=5762 RepID=D2V9U0_NAEGR|nr:uncharacterized protein NAEGRDRAFT_65627 [Naegleria gruberi]EFC46198.1 predicted protein [Naegleria gruberi]|eukprot:XP_002678942.1 predicted protein [Naegleria gruberi strain NEG-M]